VRSIRRTLLIWILGALSLGAVLVALVTYLVTLEEMNEVFDDDLRNVAEAVASYHHAGHHEAGDAPLQLPVRTDEPADTEIVTLTWTAAGERVYSSDPRVPLPFTSTEGLSRPMAGGEEWIVYSSVRPEGVAQAAQRVAARKEMAGESAGKVFPPLVGLVVLVGALLVFGLRRGLQPLDAAAADIARRSAGSLEAIGTGDAPAEIVPLVNSINGLMQRLDVAFSSQRRFLADAAHELRTPITALRLQLQWLERAADDADRKRALTELHAGVDRSQRLVQQLLQVARTEPDGEATKLLPLDLAALVRVQVAALSVKAEHAGLDLGADAPELVTALGDEPQLNVLLENLIENALRYTPTGGVVDVSARVEEGYPVILVADDGPGIPEAERRQVFERFHRGEGAQSQSREGSGLGLAIVKAIAERHGATVDLRTAASGRGLEVRVCFPAP
jgi:two-component system, OmpR family, sensor kinase